MCNLALALKLLVRSSLGTLAALATVAGGCASPPPPPPSAGAGAGAPGFAHTAFTNFSFVRGAPAAGVRLTACGRLTLTTTATERAGQSGFRIDRSGQPATVTFVFDRPVAAFDLAVGGLRADDALADFNVGNPPRLSGALLQTADGRVTAGAASGSRAAAGTLSWPEVDTREIKLTAHGGPGATIAFEGFRVACKTGPAPIQ